MKFRSRTYEISAFQFDGTFTGPNGVQAADDWVKEHDLSNVEVSCQGKQEPLALDVTHGGGIETVEAGAWLGILGDTLFVFKDGDFRRLFEAAE